MELTFASAFNPFYRFDATLSGRRNSFAFTGTAKVALVIGEQPAEGGANLARQPGENYTVGIQKADDWPVSDGPQYGDVVTVEPYGALTVQRVQPKHAGWMLVVSRNTRMRTP